METSTSVESNPASDKAKLTRFVQPRLLNLAGLTGVVLLAAWLRLSNLSSLGFANHYYAAAVKSMLLSWHNFFFVAAEPGASVSVDKPPLGLWLQAVSARLLGVNTLGLLLPQLLAGLLSIVLIYHLVRRRFGVPAGILAALVLAITPVVVATDRNNTMDSTLIFTLLLGAWAFIKATETARMRYLVAGAVLIGLAFNIKMLEAYLPLPAFLSIYLLGAQEALLRKLGKLGLTMIILFVISLSWAVAVDLTPADKRPYVGSSGDNSEISLIIGYNGIDRLLGIFKGPGSGNMTDQANPSVDPPNGNTIPPVAGFPPPNATIPPGSVQPGALINPNRGGFPPGSALAGAFAGTGQAGPLRLFIPPLSKEASWLLPLGLFSLIVLVFAGRFTWPISSQHQAAVLWGGWLVTAGIIFSGAGFFHEYYLSTLAPPLAALLGIGVIETWHLRMHHPWLAGMSLMITIALTLLLQYNTARAFITGVTWLPAVLGMFLLGGLLVIISNLIHPPISKNLFLVGMIVLITSALLTPAIWSCLTSLHPPENLALPSSYAGRDAQPSHASQLQVDTSLLNYLEANTQGTYYLMAVPSSMQGADYVLDTGRPVLYMGGFNGEDELLTEDSLKKLVTDGDLRFIYWNSSSPGRPAGDEAGGQSLINDWVTGNCQVVQAFSTAPPPVGYPNQNNDLPSLNAFLPDGQLVVLYDCGK